MSRKLVAYFSASGCTAKVAEHLAEAIGADLFEIAPKVRYTKKDLNWQDQASRSSVEMSDPSCRPEMETIRDNMADYDTVYLGFPIWWYVAPRIINTFLEIAVTQPVRKGPGFFAALLGLTSNTGSAPKHPGRCTVDCAHCPAHYGYRYGRWYYGHHHTHGCEFGGNDGSGKP